MHTLQEVLMGYIQKNSLVDLLKILIFFKTDKLLIA